MDMRPEAGEQWLTSGGKATPVSATILRATSLPRQRLGDPRRAAKKQSLPQPSANLAVVTGCVPR